MSKEYRLVRENPLFIQFCNKEIKLELMKVIGILHLNSAQTSIFEEKWLKALESVRQGKRYFEKV